MASVPSPVSTMTERPATVSESSRDLTTRPLRPLQRRPRAVIPLGSGPRASGVETDDVTTLPRRVVDAGLVRRDDIGGEAVRRLDGGRDGPVSARLASPGLAPSRTSKPIQGSSPSRARSRGRRRHLPRAPRSSTEGPRRDLIDRSVACRTIVALGGRPPRRPIGGAPRSRLEGVGGHRREVAVIVRWYPVRRRVRSRPGRDPARRHSSP